VQLFLGGLEADDNKLLKIGGKRNRWYVLRGYKPYGWEIRPVPGDISRDEL